MIVQRLLIIKYFIYSPHFRRFLAPLKRYHPNVRIRIPTVAVKVGFLDGAVPNPYKRCNCHVFIKSSICVDILICSFCQRTFCADLLQPLHPHIHNLKPDACGFFWHVDGWFPFCNICNIISLPIFVVLVSFRCLFPCFTNIQDIARTDRTGSLRCT